MRILTIVLSIITVSIGISFSQNTTNIPLPPETLHGKLDNGLTYYILSNQSPKERASFYFVQNVGAILEEDHQNGLAHFLEHMAFNGSKHFPGKKMINYLQQKGIVLGKELNAYTEKDETIYNINNIPTTDKQLMDSCLLILHDWSGSLLLEEKEIEAERGVIKEEWRTRRNISFLLREKKNQVILNHSKYAKRDVIGSYDVIANFKAKDLIDFYKKWYRPDNQAVIIVGDFDAKKMQRKVKKLFSKIPLASVPAKREYQQIPRSENIQFVLAKEKGTNAILVEWIFRKAPNKLRDTNYLKEVYLRNFFLSMINKRLIYKLEDYDCPAHSYKINKLELTRTQDATYLSIRPKQGKILEAFEDIVSELVRINQHGFTEAELKDTKEEILNLIAQSYMNASNISNTVWAISFQNHFLKAKPSASTKWDAAFAQAVIPKITLDEVNGMLSDFSDIKNSALTISGPDNAQIQYPSKKDFLQSFAKVAKQKLKQFERKIDTIPLLDASKLKAQKVVSVDTVPQMRARRYTLANGAKVVLMPTKYNEQKVVFKAFSPGGYSLIETKDLAAAQNITTLLEKSGLGNFNLRQVRNKLKGKNIVLAPKITHTQEAFEGACASKDIKTFLQMIYMSFETPHFDKEAFDKDYQTWGEYLKKTKENPLTKVQDTLALLSANYNERTVIFNQDYIDNVSFDRIKKCYLDRFQDASDFTFMFIGVFEEAEMLKLAQKYIGNISSTHRKEQWVDHKIRPVKENQFREITHKMKVPKSSVFINMFKEDPFSKEKEIYTSILNQIIKKQLIENIREREGGSYSIRTSCSVSRRPMQSVSASISFDCDPAREKSLRKIVQKQIEKICTEGCKKRVLEEVKNSLIKYRKESEVKMHFWYFALESILRNNEKIVSTPDYIKIIKEVDNEKLKQFASNFFKDITQIEIVLNPEK